MDSMTQVGSKVVPQPEAGRRCGAGPLGLLTALLLAVGLGWPAAVRAHERADEKLPPPPVRLRVIAPAARGAWQLRIDNDGPVPLRVAADVRLLSFEVRAPLSAAKRRRHRSFGWPRRARRCDGPKAFGLSDHFPIARERVVPPGGSYLEHFDPRLICFGTAAELLVPGAKVKPYYGWRPRKRWGRHMRTAPFVADAASRPRKYRPLRRLSGPTVLLSHAAPAARATDDAGKAATKGPGKAATKGPGKAATKGPGKAATKGPGKAATKGPGKAASAPKGPGKAASAPKGPGKAVSAPKGQGEAASADALAARLTLTASPYADALRPSDIELNVVVHNTGQRPLYVALRDRMLSFEIEGPDGHVHCAQQSQGHKVPRDLFHLMHHGTHVSLGVMLGEICPKRTFARAGLYLATPTLHASAEGREYGLSAATGVATSRGAAEVKTKRDGAAATLVRIRRGSKPFYRRPAPKAKAAASTEPAAGNPAKPAASTDHPKPPSTKATR